MSESSSQPRTSLLMLSQYKWQVFDIGLAWWLVGTKNKPKPKIKGCHTGIIFEGSYNASSISIEQWRFPFSAASLCLFRMFIWCSPM